MFLYCLVIALSDVIQNGDLIKINYIGRIKETGKVFSTTIKSVAEEENIFSKDRVYEPEIIIVGKGWLPEGLEKRLVGLKLNEPATIEVPFDEAYGPRNPSKIRLIHRRELQKRQIPTEKGQVVQIGNEVGTIITSVGNRVKIDFNHPLSGKDLVYEVTILERITDETEKVKSIVARNLAGFDLSGLEAGFSEDKKAIEILLPKSVFYVQYLQFAKASIAKTLKEMFSDVEKVVFKEELSAEDLV